MIQYRVTDLHSKWRHSRYIRQCLDAEKDLYGVLMDMTGNDHELSADMAAWAMLASVGDEWGTDDVRLTIEEV